jgi:hypothetical protein
MSTKIKGRHNYVVLDTTNVQQYGEHLGLKSQADYNMRSFMTTGYNPPKSKNAVDLAREGFSAEVIPDMVVKLYIENEPRAIKYEENKKALYAYMMFHISPQSLIAIKGDAAFAETEEKMCPMLLWKIIERTHRGNISSKCERINMNCIIVEYEQIKMGADENIVVYHDRFYYAAKAYHEMKKMDMKEKNNNIEIAWAFWRSLNKQVYAEFLRIVENNLNLKLMKADILFNEMYELAQSYLAASKPSVKQNVHAVFAAARVDKYAARLDDDDYFDDQDEKEEQKWKTVRGADRNKGTDRGAGEKEKDGKETKPFKIPRPIEEVQCFECRKLGHYQTDCPLRKDKTAKSGAAASANAKP